MDVARSITAQLIEEKADYSKRSIHAGLTLVAPLPMMKVPTTHHAWRWCGVPADNFHAHCLSRLLLRYQRRYVPRRFGGCRRAFRVAAANGSSPEHRRCS